MGVSTVGNDRQLTAVEVAARLHRSIRTIRTLTARRQLPHVRRAGMLIYPEPWFEEWLRGCELEVVELGGRDRVVRPANGGDDDASP